MKRVLFVDDQPEILDGLRDALRTHRRAWQMTFAGSGDEALAVLRRDAHDVVVSDMRMPGMDGAGLLARVQHSHPDTVRIVLSGFAEVDAIIRAGGVAHRFLAKPCDVDEIARIVERACPLDDDTSVGRLRRAVPRTTALPSAARLHEQLTELLAGGEATAAAAAAIVDQDPAMAAKVLQLVSSAFFGAAGRSTPSQAVARLGLETFRTLALSARAFESFRPETPIEGFEPDSLQRHCLLVGRIARGLVDEPDARDLAFAAGLMHDVGILVLAAQEPAYLSLVLGRAVREGRALVDVEREERGLTHADIGAELLALWGLPQELVEAVAHHHDPSTLRPSRLTPDGAVYVADALAREGHGPANGVACWLPGRGLDADVLADPGLGNRVAAWRALAEDLRATG
jgi:putative nucleotidyltransferase with HDIG domain